MVVGNLSVAWPRLAGLEFGPRQRAVGPKRGAQPRLPHFAESLFFKASNCPASASFSCGLRSTAFNLLTYAAAKVDVWLVGEKLSTGETGLYDRSVHLMGQPITVLGKLGDSVLFSGMSSIQGDDQQMRDVTLRAMHLVALLTIPLASALVLQAEGVTWLFLGDRFADAAPVVQILFAAVAFRALTKLGDANLRALDGLRTGIAIKVLFFLAVGGGVFTPLHQGPA